MIISAGIKWSLEAFVIFSFFCVNLLPHSFFFFLFYFFQFYFIFLTSQLILCIISYVLHSHHVPIYGCLRSGLSAWYKPQQWILFQTKSIVPYLVTLTVSALYWTPCNMVVILSIDDKLNICLMQWRGPETEEPIRWSSWYSSCVGGCGTGGFGEGKHLGKHFIQSKPWLYLNRSSCMHVLEAVYLFFIFYTICFIGGLVMRIVHFINNFMWQLPYFQNILILNHKRL